MGLDYAAIIMAGSMVSFFVLVPLFAWSRPVRAGGDPAGRRAPGGLAAEDIFFALRAPDRHRRHLRRRPALDPQDVAGHRRRPRGRPWARWAGSRAGGGAARGRAHRPRPADVGVLLGIAATGLAIFLYFRFSVLAGEPNATSLALVSTGLTLVIAFLFAAVSAWAIAMISITPISGMTLTTLIVTAVALSALGLRGESGMLQVLLIGGVVCTALSMSRLARHAVQDRLLAGRHAAPHRDLRTSRAPWLASVATTAVILLMARVYGFAPRPAHRNPLPAPQPNAMAAVLRGVHGRRRARPGSCTASAASSRWPRRCAASPGSPSRSACTCRWS